MPCLIIQIILLLSLIITSSDSTHVPVPFTFDYTNNVLYNITPIAQATYFVDSPMDVFAFAINPPLNVSSREFENIQYCSYSEKSSFACQLSKSHHGLVFNLGTRLNDNRPVLIAPGHLRLTWLDGDPCTLRMGGDTQLNRRLVLNLFCEDNPRNSTNITRPVFSQGKMCVYQITWYTKHACGIPLAQPSATCGRIGAFDLYSLRGNHVVNDIYVDGEHVTYKSAIINICGVITHVEEINPVRDENQNIVDSCDQSSVCLLYRVPEIDNVWRSEGVSAGLDSTREWKIDPNTHQLSLHMEGRTACKGQEQQPRRTRIDFICNSSSAIRYKSQPDACLYVFEWHTPIVCHSLRLSSPSPIGEKVWHGSGIALVIIVLYMGLGTEYRRRYRGYRGLQSVPHHECVGRVGHACVVCGVWMRDLAWRVCGIRQGKGVVVFDAHGYVAVDGSTSSGSNDDL